MKGSQNSGIRSGPPTVYCAGADKRMPIFKPAAAPGCWGSKYQDGERECEQCRYNDSCRSAMLERVVNPTSEVRSNVSLPMVRTNYPPPQAPAPPRYIYPQTPTPPPPPPMTVANPVIPLPSRPYIAPPVSQLPKVTTPAPPSYQPQQQVPQSYYHSTTGYSIPDHRNANPLVPMHRPGAAAPAYYFTQYPGESVSIRVIKNLVLRGLEAIFHELLQFFRHWTWPPNRTLA